MAEAGREDAGQSGVVVGVSVLGVPSEEPEGGGHQREIVVPDGENPNQKA